ncbi:tetratricopeptide repeat protein [Rufibacter immobilis]|uniref:Tetratricopeptide repeat protein n=1 Tax=Rufibacter immobilis TaxID=1348778 RepID=A0A3M9MR59_9BACT|nr:tetratricopeptide repeat protein [Rufibacter immobilis]RNI27363.1 tetratricopeptide repeat protein [Rufibacter immobilis]
MLILHSLDEFTYDLFSVDQKSGSKVEDLIGIMSEFYTVGPYKPKVTVRNGFIEVEIDADLIEGQQKTFQEVLNLSEKGRFEQAKNKLLPLIQKAPHVSEYHRVLGQIYSELGDQEEAVNSLIDALKWDRKNGWALLMMGNIFARHHNDVETALRYYDEAAKANPDDNITLNNIGAIMMQVGRKEEALRYFLQAKEINPDYPNTYQALAIVEESMGNLSTAFHYAIESIKKNANRDRLYTESVSFSRVLAQKLVGEGKGKVLMERFTQRLERRTGTTIETIADDSIDTAAKMEFAENYNRDKHIIRYKTSYPAVEHLVMHELMHLSLVDEARQTQSNQLFTYNQSHRKAFESALGEDMKRLRKNGVPEESISKFVSAIFNGINLQAYNTPIDLFIEDYLHSTYDALRPYQFISLMRLVQEGITATTDKAIVSNAPRAVLFASKVYNLVHAMLLKDLYGVDYIPDFKATPKEIKLAQTFMEEFGEYRLDREPAEEYELVQNWADDLGLSDYFELVQESEHRKERTPEDLIAEIEENGITSGEPDSYEERQMRIFQEQHRDKGLNMAVVMFMVEALQFFKGMSTKQVRVIGTEIAMKGMSGISPEKQDYRLMNIPNKVFTGYHLLAYYYVSWAIADKEFLHDLQLPFDKEYAVAKQFEKKD